MAATSVPYDRLKRVLDVVLVTIGLVVLAPVLVVLGVKVRREFGSPVVFRQPRPGLNGAIFTIRKFRTMTDERGPDGQLLPDEQRLTPFGAWLRSSSLDELPEMFNVLAGDMSLVGPRPLLVEYLPLYSPEQARRHEVRPGITGWAQVHGRNDMSWEDKLALDVDYVDRRSLRLDARILIRTLWVMVRREGISMQGHATAARFEGDVGSSEGDATARDATDGDAAGGDAAADRTGVDPDTGADPPGR
jgi:sugar transferase EpsL